MRYAIVKSTMSNNFVVFPIIEQAEKYAKEENEQCPAGHKEFYATQCYDPFMTEEKFFEIMQIEFQGW